jgi:hypothetical protein
VVEALVLGFAPFKVQGSTLHGTNNSLGPHSLVKSQQFNQLCVGKFSRVRCTRPKFTLTEVYSAGMGLKGCLEL